jgi:para-nitrobenzyl esterase
MSSLFRRGLCCGATAALALLPALVFAGGQGGAPTVTVDSETLQGEYVGADKNVAAFLGIPYAAPPVGDLRWKPPQPVKAWKGTRPARQFGPACPQPDMMGEFLKSAVKTLGGDESLVPALGPTSEDCLSLNVWTANLHGKTKQPVMVWIHGGAGFIGRGTDEGAGWVQKGVVAVSINYRLGTLGFLAHPALTAESPRHSSGAYAILDQIAALEWVHRNIAALGGDPANVTVYGQSSGGEFIGALLVSPLAKGLFQRATIQSGFPFPFGQQRLSAVVGPIESAYDSGLKLVEQLGVKQSSNLLSELRRLLVEKIVSTEPPWDYKPPVDGWVIPEDPVEALRSGHGANVPLLVGSTTDEATVLVDFFLTDRSEASYRAWLKQNYGDFDETLLGRYPISGPNGAMGSFVALVSADADCAARDEARLSTHGSRKVYRYKVSYQFPGAGGAELRAFHSIDVFLLFDYAKLFRIPIDSAGESLAETLQNYWLQFARTGNPNRTGLPEWPAYDATQDQYLDLGKTIQLKHEPDERTCDLFYQIRMQRRGVGVPH